MNFNDAMQALKAGKLIRRKAWNKKEKYTGAFDVNFNEMDYLAITFADLLAEDWEIKE